MTGPDERWTAALDAIGATRGDRDQAFADLAERHADPDRHYHTFEHASTVVDAVLSIRSDGDAWAPAVLAAWFHDAIYDATAPPTYCEGASAVLATEVLGRLGAAQPSIGEVARLVCLTARHDPLPTDAPGAVLCDADLAILAAPAADYDAYVAAVRREYAHVDDQAWRIGRPSLLRSFLDRPAIFRSPGARGWEASARSNISRELECLAR